jgi:two-component system, sensor histidine kinase and response regulator
MSQVFDEKELLDRIDNDWEFLAETVQMLSTDGRALMAEVRRALDACDAAALGRAAHTLKGMISNFCSPTTQASAFAVENIGKEGDLSSAPEAVTVLETDLDALIAALNDFVSTRSS